MAANSTAQNQRALTWTLGHLDTRTSWLPLSFCASCCVSTKSWNSAERQQVNLSWPLPGLCSFHAQFIFRCFIRSTHKTCVGICFLLRLLSYVLSDSPCFSNSDSDSDSDSDYDCVSDSVSANPTVAAVPHDTCHMMPPHLLPLTSHPSSRQCLTLHEKFVNKRVDENHGQWDWWV